MPKQVIPSNEEEISPLEEMKTEDVKSLVSNLGQLLSKEEEIQGLSEEKSLIPPDLTPSQVDHLEEMMELYPNASVESLARQVRSL